MLTVGLIDLDCRASAFCRGGCTLINICCSGNIIFALPTVLQVMSFADTTDRLGVV